MEYDDDGELSIVRTNLMNYEEYSAYCGNWVQQKIKNCNMPRTIWDGKLNQFVCPKCGWVSQFPADFINRYKQKWNK